MNSSDTPDGRQRLKVAVIGAGYFAQFHLEAWHRLQQQALVELVGIADADPARLREAASRYAPEAGYADASSLLKASKPDLLDIATPPETHLGLVRLAADNGIDCIVQKPLAPDFEQAQKTVQAAQAAGIRLVVHENFRWMPWHREMKRFIDAGGMGDLYCVSVRLRPGDGQGADAYLARQPYFQKMPRFLVHETAIHLIDTFRYLLGEVVGVTARLRRVNPVIAGEDAGYIVLEFERGTTAMIDANRSNDHTAANTRLTMGEYWLEGSAGVMRLNGDGRLFFKPHGLDEKEHDYEWRNHGFGGDCVYALQRQVVHDIASGAPSENSGAAYLRNIQIEDAVYLSHQTSRTITV